jgi:hypothetical protein
LSGDLDEKIGQIAHLDKDPSNYAEDNLAFMCLEHHTLFDSTTSQHKNYTLREVKTARRKLYEAITQRKHVREQLAQRGAVKLELAFDPGDDSCTRAFPNEMHHLYRLRVRNGGTINAHNVVVKIEAVEPSHPDLLGTRLIVRHRPDSDSVDLRPDERQYFDILEYNSMDAGTKAPVLIVWHSVGYLSRNLASGDYGFVVRAYSDEISSAPLSLSFRRSVGANYTLAEVHGPGTATPDIVAGQRARLIVLVLKPIPIPAIGHELEVLVDLRNVGQTPAYSCFYQTWIEMLPVPFADFTGDADRSESPTPTPIYPNSPVPNSIRLIRRAGLTPAELRCWQEGQMNLCFRIYLQYTDEFRSLRRANFGFEVGPAHLGLLPKYNDADWVETEHQKLKEPHVFLAHAAEDKKDVRALYERLAAHGIRPWLDEVDLLPGQAWQAEIKQAINQSDAVLACLSRNSVHKKGYVQKEFRLALSAYAAKPVGTIYLIPVKLDETETPDISIPELGVSLRDIQWVDLSTTGGFELLLEAVKRSTGSPSITLPDRLERDYDRLELALGGALQEIKSKTHGVYPAIVRCIRSGADRTEAIIRDDTLRSVEAHLHKLSESGLLEFDFASSEPYDTARRMRLHILDRALLKTIIDQLEGIG